MVSDADRLIDRLIDWSIDADGLIDWLIDWSIVTINRERWAKHVFQTLQSFYEVQHIA